MPTDLQHDLAFLQRLVTHAIRLHSPSSVEEATMLADIRDYLMYLTLDAIEDPSLARILVNGFSQLQIWLEKQLESTPVWQREAETIRFYIGWLFALDQLVSLRHEIAVMPAEKISRADFCRSWKETAEKLGLL